MSETGIEGGVFCAPADGVQPCVDVLRVGDLVGKERVGRFVDGLGVERERRVGKRPFGYPGRVEPRFVFADGEVVQADGAGQFFTGRQTKLSERLPGGEETIGRGLPFRQLDATAGQPVRHDIAHIQIAAKTGKGWLRSFGDGADLPLVSHHLCRLVKNAVRFVNNLGVLELVKDDGRIGSVIYQFRGCKVSGMVWSGFSGCETIPNRNSMTKIASVAHKL